MDIFLTTKGTFALQAGEPVSLPAGTPVAFCGLPEDENLNKCILVADCFGNKYVVWPGYLLKLSQYDTLTLLDDKAAKKAKRKKKVNSIIGNLPYFVIGLSVIIWVLKALESIRASMVTLFWLILSIVSLAVFITIPRSCDREFMRFQEYFDNYEENKENLMRLLRESNKGNEKI